MSLSAIIFVGFVVVTFCGFVFLFLRQIRGGVIKLRAEYAMSAEERAAAVIEKTKETKKAKRVIFAVIIPVGIGTLLLSIYLFLQTTAFISQATKTEGEIVAMRREVSVQSDHRQQIAYYPTFQFTTANGELVQVESHGGSDPSSSFQVGQKIEVLYDPQDPHHAKINDVMQLWFLFGFTFFFAFCLLFIPLGWTLMERILAKQDADTKFLNNQ